MNDFAGSLAIVVLSAKSAPAPNEGYLRGAGTSAAPERLHRVGGG
jgi:hypothetical protein